MHAPAHDQARPDRLPAPRPRQRAAASRHQPRRDRGEPEPVRPGGGDHRLLCGDSTNADDVKRLMAGETAALLSTDPPYCVDYTGMDRPIHDGKPSGKDWSHVYREVDIKDLGQFLNSVFSAVLPHVD